MRRREEHIMRRDKVLNTYEELIVVEQDIITCYINYFTYYN